MTTSTIANKSNKVSRKNLNAWCEANGVSKPSYEAYGRKVCAYVSCPEGVTREELEAKLEAVGCKVNTEWYRGQACTEVTNVSYFKACGWNA
jgi:hypothetical protein